MVLPQDGELSQVRYMVSFSREYELLFTLAREEKDPIWELNADRGKEFPLAVRHASEVDLRNASAADIGSLVRYFAYRGQTMEQINLNIKYKSRA